MKYRDLLKLYKDGKLSEEERIEVEKELEKQEAISEFLYDEDADLFGGDAGPEDDGADSNGVKTGGKIVAKTEISGSRMPSDADFTRAIKKAIRRAFMKMGAIVTAVVLAVVIFSQTLLPKLVDRCYFDPLAKAFPEQSVPEEEGYEPTVFETGMRAYSELFLPGRFINNSYIESNGYGDYDFVLSASVWETGKAQPTYAGKIDKNHLSFYDPAAMSLPASNAFEWSGSWGKYDYAKSLTEQVAEGEPEAYEDMTEGIIEGETVSSIPRYASGMGGDKELSREFLADLKDYDDYQAYLSFDRIMSYEDALAFCEKYDIAEPWFGVVDTFGCDVIGIYPWYKGGAIMMPVEAYPNLWGKEGEDVLGVMTEEEAKKHFISMLSFLRDHEKFADLVELDTIFYSKDHINDVIEYVQKNGVRIYGVSFSGTKEELQKIMEDDAVFSIGTEVLS